MEEADINELLSVKSIKMEQLDENGFTTSEVVIPDSISDMPQFVTEADLELINTSGEILETPLAVFCDQAEDEDTVESCESGEEVIVQIMDIRTKLSKLKLILENRLGTDLTDYTFWLQDAKMLESHKTLVEQCIRGEGEVQVNIQVRPLEKKINILDVLKPDEEVVQLADIDPECDIEEQIEMEDVVETEEEEVPVAEETVVHAAALRWVVDEQFKSDRARLRIPNDPANWSVHHVKLWIQWAVRHFKLHGVKLQNWSVSGETLVQLTHAEFKEKIPKDPGDLFWTHFELLRKCKFVAVVQQDEPLNKPSSIPVMEIMPQTKRKTKQATSGEVVNVQMVRGNNGQIQLWQFLLELLTSAEYINIIKWNGSQGEFKLLQPEKVASLWGARKHKPAMNYEKLSRALRYYYDGDMIAKVSGRSFVYKFVCDLRQLIGYDAAELQALVTEAYGRMSGIAESQEL